MKNAPRIEFSPVFQKQRKAAPPEVKAAFREALELFTNDPHSPGLRNHPLTGKYAGFRSIDVTGDWRAIYREKKDRIKFVALGTHPMLYG